MRIFHSFAVNKPSKEIKVKLLLANMSFFILMNYVADMIAANPDIIRS